MNFKEFLERKYIHWQQQEGSRKTVSEFAEWLGVKQSTVSMWWSSKRTPEGENLRKIAIKLGLEVYDILGLPRPEENLIYLESIWNDLTPEARKAIRDQAEKISKRKNG